MEQMVEINPGEIRIKFAAPVSGKTTFAELGLTDNDLVFDSGLIRMVFDFEGIGEHSYFKMPTIQVAYKEEMAETHWICDFNNETILDKLDHHGRSSVLLMDRNKLSNLEQHHENTLRLYAHPTQTGIERRAGL